MVDIINITVERNRFVRCDVETLARDGEALVHRFVITIPEKLSSLWPYLDFELPNGEKYKTARLAIEGNVITYDVPAYVLNGNGDLKTQIVLQNENGRVWKSNVKTFHVRYSVNAVDDIPEKEDFIAEAQKILDEVQGGGGGSITVDDHLDPESTNPVQNKVVAKHFADVDVLVGDIDATLDSIIAIQESLIGGEG